MVIAIGKQGLDLNHIVVVVQCFSYCKGRG